jgi:hypothetical protein
MEFSDVLKMIYEMGKMDGIKIGREQVLKEDLIRLNNQFENIERNIANGYELLSKG